MVILSGLNSSHVLVSVYVYNLRCMVYSNLLIVLLALTHTACFLTSEPLNMPVLPPVQMFLLLLSNFPIVFLHFQLKYLPWPKHVILPSLQPIYCLHSTHCKKDLLSLFGRMMGGTLSFPLLLTWLT